MEPPAGLFEKILKCIHREEQFLVVRRIIVFSTISIGSFTASIPVFKALVADFLESGFINFFSLVFSDFSVVMSSWQSFALILLETLPAISLALFFAIVLVFLQSLRSLSKNIKIIKYGII